MGRAPRPCDVVLTSGGGRMSIDALVESQDVSFPFSDKDAPEALQSKFYVSQVAPSRADEARRDLEQWPTG